MITLILKNNAMRYFLLIILGLFLVGCDKEAFRDYRYTYCYMTSPDDEYWGCHNIVLDKRLSYSDSTNIHGYLDAHVKKMLSDTSYFISRITFLHDEHASRSKKYKIRVK